MTAKTTHQTSSFWNIIKVKLASTFVLLYCSWAIGLVSLFKHRWTEGLLFSSIILAVIALLLSIKSQLRYHKKMKHINGIEQIDKESIQNMTLLKSWIDLIGDRGIAYINITLITFVFPSMFAASYQLSWGLFDVKKELSSDLNQELDFFDWIFFMACQSLDLLIDITEKIGISEFNEYVNHINTLDDSLTFTGNVVLLVFSLVLLSLALNVFIRYRDLNQVFDRLQCAVQLSAKELSTFETSHLNQIFVDHEISAYYQESLNQLQNRQYILTEFLQLFPLKRFMKRLSKLILNREKLYSKVNCRSALLESLARTDQDILEHSKSPIDNHILSRAIVDIAWNASQESYPPMLRCMALYTLVNRQHKKIRIRNLSATQLDQLQSMALDLLHRASGHSASIKSGITYERLVLASAYILVRLGERQYLGIILNLIRSRSPILRKEAKNDYTHAIQLDMNSVTLLSNMCTVFESAEDQQSHLVQDLQTLLNTIDEMIQSYTKLGTGTKTNVDTNINAKSKSKASSKTKIEAEAEIDFNTLSSCQAWYDSSEHQLTLDSMMLCLSHDFTNIKELEATLQILKRCFIPAVIVRLCALLNVPRLPQVLKQELLNSIQGDQDWYRHFSLYVTYMIRTASLKEKFAVIKIIGHLSYQSKIHDLLIRELNHEFKVKDYQQVTVQKMPDSVAYHLILALAHLCRTQEVSAKYQDKTLNIIPNLSNVSLQSIKLYLSACLGNTEHYFDLFAHVFPMDLAHKEPNEYILWSQVCQKLLSFEHATLSSHLPVLDQLHHYFVKQYYDYCSQIDQNSLPSILERYVQDHSNTVDFVYDKAQNKYLSNYKKSIKITKQKLTAYLIDESLDLSKLDLKEDILLLDYIKQLTRKLLSEPSAFAMMIMMYLTHQHFPWEIRQIALRRMKSLNSRLKPSLLGVLNHQSSQEWMSTYIIQRLKIEVDSSAKNSMLLLLGYLKSNETHTHLWKVVQNSNKNADERAKAVQAIGRQRNHYDVDPLIEIYSGVGRTIQQQIIFALTEIKGKQVQEYLTDHLMSFPAHSNIFKQVIKFFKDQKQLQVIIPLIQKIETFSLDVQVLLLKAYVALKQAPHLYDHVILDQAIDSQGLLTLSLSCLEDSNNTVTRTIASALPFITTAEDQNVYHQLLVSLQDNESPIKVAEISAALVKIYQNSYVEVLQQALRSNSDMMPMSLIENSMNFSRDITQSQSIKVPSLHSLRSMFVISLQYANQPVKNFVPYAIDCYENNPNPSEINQLAGPFLKYAKREAVPYIKKLIQKQDSRYSYSLLKYIVKYGDSIQDAYWVHDILEEVQEQRYTKEMKLAFDDHAKLEVALLNTLREFGQTSALSELIELSLGYADTPIKVQLQKYAYKEIQFLNLNQMIVDHQDLESD
jgi:hypothetical protein